jgi:hypothetical protein
MAKQVDNFSNFIIGLDMDGVVIDNTASKVKFARQLGLKLKAEQAQSDIIEKILPVHSLEQLRKLLYQHPVSALEAKTISGVKSGLAWLRKSGRQFFLISRRRAPEIARQTLIKEGLWPTYFNETNAFFVQTPEEKNLKALELGVKIYLDDQPSVLEKLVDVPHRFLMDRFNLFQDVSHKRVSSWQEFISHLA